MEEEKKDNSRQRDPGGGYGKRPFWQWVLIYLVVGGLVYWLVYYFILADNNGGSGLY